MLKDGQQQPHIDLQTSGCVGNLGNNAHLHAYKCGKVPERTRSLICRILRFDATTLRDATKKMFHHRNLNASQPLCSRDRAPPLLRPGSASAQVCSSYLCATVQSKEQLRQPSLWQKCHEGKETEDFKGGCIG
jgi:hypothetical protein